MRLAELRVESDESVDARVNLPSSRSFAGCLENGGDVLGTEGAGEMVERGRPQYKVFSFCGQT